MSLWTQGCPHHCKGCFNGETWDFNSGKEFRKEDLDYILKNINKNSVQRDLSILGGEPFAISLSFIFENLIKTTPFYKCKTLWLISCVRPLPHILEPI